MPKGRNSSLLTPDDFSIDQPMMVFRNRNKKVFPGPEGMTMEFVDRSLSNVVLEIKAIQLPFIFVNAICPIRGQQNLLVDTREYEFIRVDQEFADQIKSMVESMEQQAGDQVHPEIEPETNRL